MASTYPIAALAGVVSALLFASATGGNALAVPLVYLAPLPLFLAGLGWGMPAVFASGLAGTLVLLAVASGYAGAGYFVTLAVPAAVLVYLALLSRQSSAPAPGSAGPGAPAGLEWYPPGNLVTWAAVMGGGLTALTVPLLGMDAETYRASLQTILENTVLKDIEEQMADQLDADQLAALTSFLVRALPAISASVWFLTIVLNMWAAGRIIERLRRGLRPWPKIEAMTFPQEFSFAFVAVLILSAFDGIIGIIATGFAGSFITAYVLLGLAVIHALTRVTQFRPILLSMLYMGLVLFGWIALIVASIGIGEPIFKLREKFSQNTGNAGRNDD